MEDVAEIVRDHFGEGKPVARLLSGDEAALRSEILENKRKYLVYLAAQRAGK